MTLRPDSLGIAVPVAVNPVDVADPLPAREEPAPQTEAQAPVQTAPRQTQATWQRQAPTLPRIPAGPANIVPPYRLDATFMYPIAGKVTAPAASTADTQHTLPGDSISMAADSTAQVEKAPPAIVLTPPKGRQLPEINMPDPTTSWVTGLLLLLFCLVCFRFRNNKKYVTGLLRDLFEVRERHNVFEDTVRETSFLVLLNILWSVSAGVLLWGTLLWAMPYNATFSFTMPAEPAGAMKICIGVTLCYTILMSGAYYIVGCVFSDRRHAAMWVKGYAASQALLCVIFFPLALLCLYYPEWRGAILAVALGGFITAKIIFICKGFRIFFAQLSSWVLFLYYLCSLELVPLALTFFSACQLCAYMLH